MLITVQLALLSESYLEQLIFLANTIMLTHNIFRRGRLHMYYQSSLGNKKNPTLNQQKNPTRKKKASKTNKNPQTQEWLSYQQV